MRNTLRGVLQHIDHTKTWPVELGPDAAGKLNHYAQVWLRLAAEAAHHAHAAPLQAVLPIPGHTAELMHMDWAAQGAVLAQELIRVSDISIIDPVGDALRRAICAGYAWRLGETMAYGQFSAGTEAQHAVGLMTLMQRAALWGRLAVSSHRPTFRHVTNALMRTPSWDAELARQVPSSPDRQQQRGWMQTFSTPRADRGRDVLVVSGPTEINADPAFLLLNGLPFEWKSLCNVMANAPLAH